MTTIDPTTGTPLPPDAIQRILFIAPKTHVYQIPPLTSTKGYNASSWTADNNARQIFTARLRILETAIPNPSDDSESVSTSILLEDPATGQLFAAAPYTDASSVEQVLDSSRFFAIRVVGDGGRKAVLGIGFEERSEAFDFGISLQEVRKVSGLESPVSAGGGGGPPGKGPPGSRKGSGQAATAATLTPSSKEAMVSPKKDFSLKEGQTIHIDLGRKHARPPRVSSGEETVESPGWIAPPSGGGRVGSGSGDGLQAGAMSFLPPPPSAQAIKAEKRKSRQNVVPESGSAAELGFDDGEFGEFQ